MPSSQGLPPVERRAWIALGVSTLAALLTVIDVSIVNVAFPSIRRDLGASEAGLSWVLSGYSISVGAFLLLAGRLADQKGRRLLFMIGVGVFVVGSFLSGMAESVTWLVSARVLQGVGGSILGPSSMSMVLPEFPPERRSMVIGIWGASAALGAAVGPSLGAILIDLASWRWIFLVNVPIGLVLLAITPRVVRETRDPDARGGYDLMGVPAGTLGIALLLLGVVEGERWGYGSGRTLATVGVGLVLVGRPGPRVLYLRIHRHDLVQHVVAPGTLGMVGAGRRLRCCSRPGLRRPAGRAGGFGCRPGWAPDPPGHRFGSRCLLSRVAVVGCHRGVVVDDHDAAGPTLPRDRGVVFLCHLRLPRPPGCAAGPLWGGQRHAADPQHVGIRCRCCGCRGSAHRLAPPRAPSGIRPRLGDVDVHLHGWRCFLRRGLSGQAGRGTTGTTGQAARPNRTGSTSRPRRMIRAL